VKKRKLRATTPFKVIQDHRHRYKWKARKRPFTSDLYWHPISYRLEVIADNCLNIGQCVFATYTVHIRLIGPKARFLLVLLKLISLGVTAEALRANINW